MIRFEQVNKVYDDGFQALKDINLEISEGELVTLIGPSGCGKTTTMKMVNRLIEPSDGNILINGRNIMDQNPVELRRDIGYVIQQIGLLPHMTIADNIAIVPKLKNWPEEKYKKRVDELLELVGLDPSVFKDRYPAELSGGQQQRVGVVRAMAAEPPIILMDEPFSALDPISREQLQDELIRLQQTINKTILFVTHDMDEALKIADRICLMNKGEIVQLDTPETILRHPKNDFVREFIGEERLQQNGMPTLPQLKKLIVKAVSILEGRGLAEALKMMRNKRVDSLLVVDKTDQFKGIASIWDVQQHYQNEKLTLKDIMKTDVPTLQLDSDVEEAFEMVNQSRQGFVTVVDESGKLRGIVNRASLVEHIVGQLFN
ncbi:betaine/proline/choline family ABC transporter ATP-binding protein [Pullulanibacillus sp. KACC 23026]|uniref:ABC transporter ATP-binding protein n=1 Tax=Pullulanibacillus sp. KACC 23026 TaxID=3028315 RepID=UPI0023AF1553|nr:betaine/proline/choline family ABC transporter ATP-binding protein [Pullulanibacillus sp. KACC 23026]WEG13674.1 betaine/proline/choline family ABC transporter ATP-binding protein [Pullulanibacillus sp. KACC 23026]